MSNSSAAVTVQLAIQGGQLALTVANVSSGELRIWEWQNSWGWDALVFELEGDDGLCATISHKPREWTKNGPDTVVLAPNESRQFGVNLQDGWWQCLVADQQRLAEPGWRDKPLRLRARLQILPTPESDRLGTFTGCVCSAWTLSRPPNDWLVD